jgi:hypothetical protein
VAISGRFEPVARKSVLGTFMGNNEVLKLGKGKNPIANTPTNWTATISTSASEQDQ